MLACGGVLWCNPDNRDGDGGGDGTLTAAGLFTCLLFIVLFIRNVFYSILLKLDWTCQTV